MRWTRVSWDSSAATTNPMARSMASTFASSRNSTGRAPKARSTLSWSWLPSTAAWIFGIASSLPLSSGMRAAFSRMAL